MQLAYTSELCAFLLFLTFLTFRDHLHVFEGQSSPVTSAVIQFVLIFPGAVDQSLSTSPFFSSRVQQCPSFSLRCCLGLVVFSRCVYSSSLLTNRPTETWPVSQCSLSTISAIDLAFGRPDVAARLGHILRLLGPNLNRNVC